MKKHDYWNGHEIRFVERSGEWWAVAVDVCGALGLQQVTRALKGLSVDGVTTGKVIDGLGREQESNMIDERNIYRLIFRSRKPEALEFQDWIYSTIQQLRKTSGLEAFQVFRMLDKEHQREAMNRLHDALKTPALIDYVKANTIANKAVSTLHGYKKLVKKDQMTPGMLIDRQRFLDDTIELMSAREKYGLALSVSETIYSRHGKRDAQ